MMLTIHMQCYCYNTIDLFDWPLFFVNNLLLVKSLIFPKKKLVILLVKILWTFGISLIFEIHLNIK